MKNFFYKYILPPIAFLLIFLINSTLKVQIINRSKEKMLEDDGENRLYTFWHGRLFYFPYLYRWRPHYTILASPSVDGEIISRILHMFGFSTIRGSSYKSGREAYWKLMKAIKAGHSVVMIGDGSRGPRYTMQKGIISLAKHTGAPIIPMIYSAKKKKMLSTWDNFIIPYPFSDVVVIYGDPLYVQKNDSIEKKRIELETILNNILHKADTFFQKKG